MDNGISGAALKALEDMIPGEREPENGDYVGEDGLLYCGKCNTRKERIIRMPELIGGGGERKVPIICKCQAEKEAKRKEEEQYREEMNRLQRIRDASLMDAKYRAATFDSYLETKDNRKAHNVAVKYVDNFKSMYEQCQGIIFWGPVGTGKSFTAACIANALLDRRISVIMTSFVKILQNIQNGDEAQYIAMLNNAKLLILDDLGTERNTDYALEKVYNIIDSRSRAAKPMILTTNLSLRDMLEASDVRYQRIYDRIFETCLPVEVSGESFRRISAERRFDKMAEYMEG